MKFVMSLYLLINLALLSCGAAEHHNTSELTNVIGDDDRSELATNSLPGRAIGRLDGGCTAFMVGKNYAMTAAHCVYNPETQTLRTDLKTLKVAPNGDTSFAESWISSVWIGTTQPVEERSRDWAILKLEKDIGTKTGWFGVSNQNILQNLPFTTALAGYTSDIDGGEKPHVQTRCYIMKIDENGRLLHECDTSKGSSGSPMFTKTNDGYYVAAINVAEFRDGDESMTVNSYSHQYANIAVDANQFQQILGDVRASATDRQVAGALYFANTNASEERSTTELVPIERRPQQRVNEGWRSVREAPAFTNRAQINQEAASLHADATAVWNYANSTRRAHLANLVRPVVNAAHAVSTSAYNLATHRVEKDLGLNILGQQFQDLNFQTTAFLRNFDFYYRAGTREYVEIGTRVRYISQRLQRLNGLMNGSSAQK